MLGRVRSLALLLGCVCLCGGNDASAEDSWKLFLATAPEHMVEAAGKAAAAATDAGFTAAAAAAAGEAAMRAIEDDMSAAAAAAAGAAAARAYDSATGSARVQVRSNPDHHASHHRNHHRNHQRNHHTHQRPNHSPARRLLPPLRSRASPRPRSSSDASTPITRLYLGVSSRLGSAERSRRTNGRRQASTLRRTLRRFGRCRTR